MALDGKEQQFPLDVSACAVWWRRNI